MSRSATSTGIGLRVGNRGKSWGILRTRLLGVVLEFSVFGLNCSSLEKFLGQVRQILALFDNV